MTRIYARVQYCYDHILRSRGHSPCSRHCDFRQVPLVCIPGIVRRDICRTVYAIEFGKLYLWPVPERVCKYDLISLIRQIQNKESELREQVSFSAAECGDDLPRVVQPHVIAKLHEHASRHKVLRLPLCTDLMKWKSEGQEIGRAHV